MTILIEIRPGEGGRDAELLVASQSGIYINFAERNHARTEILETGR